MLPAILYTITVQIRTLPAGFGFVVHAALPALPSADQRDLIGEWFWHSRKFLLRRKPAVIRVARIEVKP